MANLHIGTLRIEAAGLAPEQGPPLAQGIARGLARAGALPEWGDVPTLSIAWTGPSSGDVSDWADHIVAAILREISARGTT